MWSDAVGITDIGLKRDRNEDAFLVNDELSLVVVADGMGGHAGGQHASALAVNTVEEMVGELALPTGSTGGVDPVEVLRTGLDELGRADGAAGLGELLEHDDVPPLVGEEVRRHQSVGARADDDGVVAHPCSAILRRRSRASWLRLESA